MTYQELLDELCKRRASLLGSSQTIPEIRIQNLEWAIQSILEKLRDRELWEKERK